MHPLILLLAELFFYLALPLTVGYAWVFGYHWYQYGTEPSQATSALVVFLGGAAIFLAAMFLSLQYVS